MADWSQLPKDLLLLISEKLNSEIYLIRFRSVCSTWRFSIPKPHNHFPLNLPPFSNDSNILKLYKHDIFLIKPPTTSNQQTLRPWLVRISPTSTGKFNLWHPLLRHNLILPSDLRVLDFSKLSVFNIGRMYNMSSTVYCRYDGSVATFQGEQIQDSVATFQGGEILDIVTREYFGELVMLRYGDDCWTKIPNDANFYHDICIFKGRPCAVDKTGRTVMIRSDLSIHLVAEPVCDCYLDGYIKIVVENESELLLVHKSKDLYGCFGSECDYGVDVRVMFDVFRLDQKEKKWLKLSNLGDTIVFFGQRDSSFGQCDSFTASALDLGFDKGNFVIYCNDNHDVKSEMIIFHLDTQWNFPLSGHPDYLNLFWPPPEWIAQC